MEHKAFEVYQCRACGFQTVFRSTAAFHSRLCAVKRGVPVIVEIPVKE